MARHPADGPPPQGLAGSDRQPQDGGRPRRGPPRPQPPPRQHPPPRAGRPPPPSRRTVGDYAEDYLARNDLRESTRALYAGLWRHHLAKAWTDVPVDAVTPAPAPPPSAPPPAPARPLAAGLWRHHLAKAWTDVPVDEVTPAAVRSWHAKAGRTTG